jgi:AraC-like DNA-binding protein
MREPSEPLVSVVERVRGIFGDSWGDEHSYVRLIDGLAVVQSRRTTSLGATLYDPVVCLILQGSKELAIGERRIMCRPGESVVVSHDIPVASRIAEASSDTPYLAVIMTLKLTILRSVIDDLNDVDHDETSAAIQVGAADHYLLDAMERLLALSGDSRDEAVLAPLIQREIHYRLLCADHGAALRHLARPTGASAAIATSIAQIREDLAKPLSVPELARRANMSQSTFHHHFRAITETTPLQYQKQLRLLEARRILIEEVGSVHQSARLVGYRSATQFSREYSRAFGSPPRDARRETAQRTPGN